jgi:hypothetical protein
MRSGGQDDPGASQVSVRIRAAFARTVSSRCSSADKMITNGEEMITICCFAVHRSEDARHTVAPMIWHRGWVRMGPWRRFRNSTQWQRLTIHSQQRRPQISQIHTLYRPGSPTSTPSSPTERRCRYAGSAPADRLTSGGFAIYRASHDDYEDSYLPNGYPVGTAEEALDTACGLYLNDPTAWI